MGSGPKVARTAAGSYMRTSSGLVRAVGTFDTFLYGIMQVAIAYVIFMIATWFLYPGASMELAMLIAVAGAVPLAVTYALFSAVYPRSGGEYVFLSRTTHPALGFVLSFAMALWQCFYVGLNGAFTVVYGIAPLFAVLGLQTRSGALTDVGEFFGRDAGMFVGGAAMIALFAFLLCRGMRTYFRVQKLVALVAFPSLALTLLVLLLTATGTIDFGSAFDDLAGRGAHDAVLAGTAADGVNLDPGFSFKQTLFFVIWPAFSVLFPVLAVSFSGEIKNVRRGQLLGMTSSVVVGGAMLLIVMVLTRSAVGADWLIAASASADFPLSTPPFANTIAAIAGGSWVLTLLMGVWVVALMGYTVGVVAVYASRALFAWGVDDVAPAALGSTSSRSRAPVTAIVTAAAVGLVCLALYAFSDWVTILSGLVGFTVVFFITSIATALFPFTHKEAFEGSPAAIRVGGVPLMTISGTLAAIFVAFCGWRAYVDEGFGANSTRSLVVNLVVFAVGALWYLAVRQLRRREGLDLDRRFAEIPVE